MTSHTSPTLDYSQPTQVVVLGAARSGLAAAHFLKRRQFTVSVSDSGPIAIETQQSLSAAGIPFEANGHQESTLAQATYLIASPGIPTRARPFQIAQQYQIPIISEIELACAFDTPRLIAVTGSNGKSTTVALLEYLLQAAGYRAKAGGNYGVPIMSLLEQNLDFIVLELSSFQLETTYSLAPEIAVLLNLYENHLDRHGDMASYFAAKMRIFVQQKSAQDAVLNALSPWCQQAAQQIPAQVHWFGEADTSDIKVTGSGVQIDASTEVAFAEIALPGKHNLENILAVLTVARILKLPAAIQADSLKQFKGIAHRLESVCDWQERRFINDSKSTNYLAAQKAIESLSRPIVLITGGQDKGGDFGPLTQRIQEGVKNVVLMGASASDFQHRLIKSGYNQIRLAENMSAAVRQAFEISEPGDVILLSPATASYDAYHNFEERGEDFKAHVAALISES